MRLCVDAACVGAVFVQPAGASVPRCLSGRREQRAPGHPPAGVGEVDVLLSRVQTWRCWHQLGMLLCRTVQVPI